MWFLPMNDKNTKNTKNTKSHKDYVKNNVVLKRTGTTNKIWVANRKRQIKFLGDIMRREGYENLTRRTYGKQENQRKSARNILDNY